MGVADFSQKTPLTKRNDFLSDGVRPMLISACSCRIDEAIMAN
jgi:hypothetical protein